MLESISDRELVALCVSGSKEAWDLFVDRFARLIHWSIIKTLERSPLEKNHDIHDEIFQKVFERILKNEGLSNLRDISSLKQFIVVMSGRMASDKLKETERAKNRYVSAQEPNPLSDDLSDGFERLMTKGSDAPQAAERERQRVFCEIFDELSAKEQACFEYCYLNGMTHREIAQVLELPQDTVSTIIRRTKDKLRKRLREIGFDEY